MTQKVHIDESQALQADEQDPSAQELIAAIEKQPLVCGQCQQKLSPHEELIKIALGLGAENICINTQAKILGQDPKILLDRAYQHIQARDCYREAWQWCSRHLDPAIPADSIPSELKERAQHGSKDSAPPSPHAAENLDQNPAGVSAKVPAGVPAVHEPPASTPPPSTQHWNAGDLSCGELVLKLRLQLRAMAPKEILHLTSYDISAREDIPAWCGLTGHRLITQQHPEYWIERKEDE